MESVFFRKSNPYNRRLIFEDVHSFSPITQPDATLSSKADYLRDLVVSRGMDYYPRVMMNADIMRAEQYRVSQEYGVFDSRFVTQEAKDKVDKYFLGVKDMSRFYGARFVPPASIAADIGMSSFTDTSNFIPTGNSISVDGSTPLIRAPENPDKAMSMGEYLEDGFKVQPQLRYQTIAAEEQKRMAKNFFNIKF